MKYLRNPGLWILSASLLLLFLFQIAEFLYPGYSVSSNTISDLGVGPEPSRTIFSVALIVFGPMVLMAAALFYEKDHKSLLWLFVAIAGIGALGVALFNENDYSQTHYFFSGLAFGFGNIAAVYSFKLTKAPFAWISLILGTIGLASLLLYAFEYYLGLGQGGMERIVFFCAMVWALSYGGYLLAIEAMGNKA
jgi:hypothetical membrane protein